VSSICCHLSQSFQDQLARSYNFNGFPVVQGEMFLGFVGREKLRLALGLSYLFVTSLLNLNVPIEQLLSERSPTELARECTFSHTYATSDTDLIDLSSLMEVSVLELRTEVPLELVVNTIQRMVCIFPLSFSDRSTRRATPYRTCGKYFSHREGNLWV
jgi:hypothetical protein